MLDFALGELNAHVRLSCLPSDRIWLNWGSSKCVDFLWQIGDPLVEVGCAASQEAKGVVM
jgi:hypothetical protein